MSVRKISILLCGLSVSAAACGGSQDNGAQLSAQSSANAFDAGPALNTGFTTTSNVPPPITTPTKAADGSDNCLVQPIDTGGVPPDMLIVLDKSFSMAATRWAPSVAAVKDLTAKYEASIQFGLTTYPGDGLCGGGKLDVPVAPKNAGAIATAISATGPIGFSTPTAQGLTAALQFLGPRAAGGPDMAAARPAYVLLVTDGEPSCPDGANLDPAAATVAATTALMAAGIKVYVVGYNVGNANLMNSIAQAGGTGKYYPVEDGAQLQAAFQEITKNVVRCDFDLLTSDTVPNPGYIYVTIDGVQRKLDEVDGWSIVGKHITLQGTACNVLKDGAAHVVQAEQRCELVR